MFEKIIGNDKVKELLKNSVKTNQTSHSYLFIGTEGIGKKQIAREFAKMLLCVEEEKYGNKCKSCIEFDTQNNPDFMEIEPDGNSIKIEQIRNLQRKVVEKPIISNKKVYLINDSDKMTQEAQNCLLKTLEEPPEFVTIILVGANENSFLSTIKSRCMILHFEEIPDKQIQDFLTENYGITIQSENMLKTFQGSIGKAIELKDKQEQYQAIENLILNLESKDELEILKQAEIFSGAKEDIQDMLDYCNLLFLTLAKRSSKYTRCIQIVENTKKRLKSNSNYDMTIDNMIFKCYEEVNRK